MEFKQFVAALNVNQLGLRFTSAIAPDKIPFLDIMILRSNFNTVETTLYRKPTATNSLLHRQSHHPTTLKKGIPTGQYLRLRHNCSSKTDFGTQAHDLRLWFLQKGYPDHILRKAFRKAVHSDRTQLLIPKKPKTSEGSPPTNTCHRDL